MDCGAAGVSDYLLVERTPTVQEFCDLRVRVGLSAKTAEAAAAGLPNTLYAVVLEHEGVAIGMGRVIGDGGTAFQVTDIALLPEHQKRGLGKRIVEALVS
jgi:GNAT superfamily N-acetyltransferase